MAVRRLMNANNLFCSSMNKSLLIKLSTKIIFQGAPSKLICLGRPSNTSLDKENNTLVNNLESMGVDVQVMRQRHPGILRKHFTNEEGLKNFLQARGADQDIITSVISRYPRAISQSYQSLEERWEIWRSILKTDLEILTILRRSPESFFRSGNNENMQKNIKLLCSLGLASSDLCKMLTRTPRVFSNSAELNKQMVDLLREIYLSLGGKNQDDFVKQLISRNVFIFLRSSKQVKANIYFLQSSFNLDDEELLMLLRGQGGDVVDLSNEYLKKTFANVKEKLLSHGCTENEVDMFVLKHLRILYLSPQNLNDKIDFLLQANIDIQQIVKCPLVLEKSVTTISHRIEILEKLGYNFTIYGIGILTLSEQRFALRLEKLHCT